MNRSDSIAELVAALAEAQKEFTPVLKDSENPFYKSKYADLASVITATQPALSKHGLTVIQFPVTKTTGPIQDGDTEAGIETLLAHKSGQFIESSYIMPLTGKRDAQAAGSVFTYFRRYAYMAAIGAAPEDDDGNAAVGSKDAAKSVAVEKLKTKANGDETLFMTPYLDNKYVALSGNGVSILRAALSTEEKDKLEIKLSKDNKIVYAPVANGFGIQDACIKHNIPCAWKDVPPPQQYIDNSGDKAVIDIAKDTGALSDPIIERATILTPKGKKPFMMVTWNGATHSLFDNKFWPILQAAAHTGKTGWFEIKVKGQYSNITKIVRLDGVDFSDPMNQTSPVEFADERDELFPNGDN